MGWVRRIFVAVVLLLIGSACSVTRHIPQGQYLLQRVKIEPDRTAPRDERIPASELEKYVRQSPNKRLFGTNFYVWLYEQADPDKQNGWNNWKRRIGQEPVLLDMDLTLRSVQNLKVYMDSKGFFSSRAGFEIDTTSRRRRAKVTFRTRQGEPFRIDTITYEFRDKFLEQLVLPDTVHRLVRPGDVFDITVLDAERERITAYLKERGYYNFTVNNIEYIADTLGGNNRVDLRMIVRQDLTGYDEHGRPQLDNNAVYRIERINVFPDYDPTAARLDSTFLSRLDTLHYRGLNVIYEKSPNVRPSILRRAIPLYPNYIYNASQINRTYSDLMGLGYFKSARLAFSERPHGDTVHYVAYVGPSADSAETRYTKEKYLECNIFCTPTLRQSFKAELEGSTTSSFYGLKATVGYQNRNIFRGAEALDISFTVGYEFMKAPDAKRKHATEFGVTAGLTFPRFLLPWRASHYHRFNQPKTKVELSINFQDRPYYNRTLSSAGITYQWANNRYSTFSLRPIDINLIDVTRLDPNFLQVDGSGSSGSSGMVQNRYLVESFKTQFVGGLSFSYGFNNQRRNLGGNATNIRFNLETAGNLIDAVEHLFWSRPKGLDHYTIFGIRYSQYFRSDLSVSRKVMLGDVTSLVGRLYGGVAMAYGNSSAVPFDRQFYCGGSNGMRGWTPRTLGQGSVPDPHDAFPIQTGDVKLEANLELRFPIWGIVHGATFFDVGNVWYIKRSPDYSDDAVFFFDNFYKQLGFNTGFGLRFDIKFFVLRLDWGIQLHNPNNPRGAVDPQLQVEEHGAQLRRGLSLLIPRRFLRRPLRLFPAAPFARLLLSAFRCHHFLLASCCVFSLPPLFARRVPPPPCAVLFRVPLAADPFSVLRSRSRCRCRRPSDCVHRLSPNKNPGPFVRSGCGGCAPASAAGSLLRLVLRGRHACIALEVAAEKGLVRKVELVGDLLNAQVRVLEQGLGLGDDEGVDPLRYGPSADAFDKRCEVLRRDAEPLCIVSDAALLPEVFAELPDELLEILLGARLRRPFGLGMLADVAVQHAADLVDRSGEQVAHDVARELRFGRAQLLSHERKEVAHLAALLLGQLDAGVCSELQQHGHDVFRVDVDALHHLARDDQNVGPKVLPRGGLENALRTEHEHRVPPDAVVLEIERDGGLSVGADAYDEGIDPAGVGQLKG